VNKIDRRSALEQAETMKAMAIRAAEEDGRNAEKASRPFDLRLRGLSAQIPPQVRS